MNHYQNSAERQNRILDIAQQIVANGEKAHPFIGVFINRVNERINEIDNRWHLEREPEHLIVLQKEKAVLQDVIAWYNAAALDVARKQVASEPPESQ